MNKDAVIRLVNEQMWTKTDVPSFQAGDTITVTYKIVEGNKERLQSFRGVVIQIKGTGKTKMFTIRKISNCIGVERIFPLYSPHIESIEVNKQGVVRRARIYYLRNLTGKKARIKEERAASTKQILPPARKKPPFERRLFSLTRIFTTPIPAPAKKTLFRPGKHLVRHRVVDFETPDNNFSQLPTDKTKIELRPAFPRPTEEPHIPANTRPSAVRTTDDPETFRINSLPPKSKKVANEYRLQPSRPPGRLRREGDSNP